LNNRQHVSGKCEESAGYYRGERREVPLWQ